MLNYIKYLKVKKKSLRRYLSLTFHTHFVKLFLKSFIVDITHILWTCNIKISANIDLCLLKFNKMLTSLNHAYIFSNLMLSSEADSCSMCKVMAYFFIDMKEPSRFIFGVVSICFLLYQICYLFNNNIWLHFPVMQAFDGDLTERSWKYLLLLTVDLLVL